MAKEGPGCYLPDETEGIDRIEDLPKPRIEKRNRSRRKCECPGCGHASTRKHVRQRQLHDLGDARTGCPIELRVRYSEHYCCKCGRWFTVDLSDLAVPNGHYTHRVVAAAVRWSSRTACLTAPPVGTYGATTASSSPSPRSRTGSRRRGKKGRRQVEQEYLDDALARFSGYIAIDELYDGPFCVLSIVDNRTYRRLAYRVLDHSPKATDIGRFLKAFKKQLDDRSLKRRRHHHRRLGPVPRAAGAGLQRRAAPDLPFHVIKELTLSILHALAKVRKEMKAKTAPLPRGRPKQDATQAVPRRPAGTASGSPSCSSTAICS